LTQRSFNFLKERSLFAIVHHLNIWLSAPRLAFMRASNAAATDQTPNRAAQFANFVCFIGESAVVDNNTTACCGDEIDAAYQEHAAEYQNPNN
jgi:hypothetical protein